MATTGKINGTDLLVYVGATAITHTQGCKLSIQMDTRDTSTKDSSGWKDTGEAQMSWSIDGEGVFTFDATYGWEDLFALLSGRTSATVKMATDESGDNNYSGTAWLTKMECDGPMEDTSTYSYTFEGFGALAEAANV